jgi:predicted Zn-dependent protease
MESKFSREFETEADLYAVQLMRAAKVDPVHLANMLKRLSSQSHDSSGKALSYFSTHPLTAERIKAITSTSATVPPETTVHK